MPCGRYLIADGAFMGRIVGRKPSAIEGVLPGGPLRAVVGVGCLPPQGFRTDCAIGVWRNPFPQISFFSAIPLLRRLHLVVEAAANIMLGHGDRSVPELLGAWRTSPVLSVLSVRAFARRYRNWNSLSPMPAFLRASRNRRCRVSSVNRRPCSLTTDAVLTNLYPALREKSSSVRLRRIDSIGQSCHRRWWWAQPLDDRHARVIHLNLRSDFLDVVQ